MYVHVAVNIHHIHAFQLQTIAFIFLISAEEINMRPLKSHTPNGMPFSEMASSPSDGLSV